MTIQNPVWLNATEDKVFISVYVQPGAKKENIVGVYGDKLKIALVARPIEGQANRAVIALLSKKLKTAKSNITVVNGELSRAKRIEIKGCSPEEIVAALLP